MKTEKELWEAISQVYKWSIDKDGEPEPPYIKNPFPDFVNERLKWVSKET